MTYQTPCQTGNPEDWFISRDGKQYSDDDLVSEEFVLAHLTAVDPNGTRSVEEIDAVWNRLEAEAIRGALVRRRHAKDACYTCYFRTQCLGVALEGDLVHGTFGGYYEEELREIRKERSRRERVRRNRATLT